MVEGAVTWHATTLRAAARDGFEANEYVEISGHATQSGGAFANIYEIAQVPTANGPESDPSIDVTVEPRSTNQFRKDQDITVVVRVAKVWVTVLGKPAQQPGAGSAAGVGSEATAGGQSAEEGTMWDHVRVVSPLNGESWSPQGGN